MTVTDQLLALRADAMSAADAHREARAEQERAGRAVTEQREALTDAYAARDDDAIKAAKRALEKAQQAAHDVTLVARVEGAGRAARTAEAAGARFVEEHLVELIEEQRPAAEAAVAAIKERVADLEAACDRWNQLDQRIATLTRSVQWFLPSRDMPADPLGDLRSALRGVGDIPLPMPKAGTLENPAQREERARREHEQRTRPDFFHDGGADPLDLTGLDHERALFEATRSR